MRQLKNVSLLKQLNKHYKKLITPIIFLSLCFGSFAQTHDKLKEIVSNLENYNTYQSDCNYTFSMPYSGPVTFESTIITQQMPSDTLCGFFYSFITKENYRSEKIGDFSMYFNKTVYKSYKNEITKTTFEEKPRRFVDIKMEGGGYHPSIQTSSSLYYITPSQLAKTINTAFKDDNATIVQMPDSFILNQNCIRYIITTHDTKCNITLDLCFNKNKLYPVYYKKDIKSDIMNQYDIAYFSNTQANHSISDNYFTEENLLPANWETANTPAERKQTSSLIGKKAPNWRLPILNSSEFLSKKDLKGKYILMEFTATWCGHCIPAVKMMNRLEDKFGDNEKLAILSIFSCQSDNEKGIKKFADKHDLRSTVLHSASKVGEKYHIYSYPNFVIISPDGNVFMNFNGYSSGVEENISNVISKLIE